MPEGHYDSISAEIRIAEQIMVAAKKQVIPPTKVTQRAEQVQASYDNMVSIADSF